MKLTPQDSSLSYEEFRRLSGQSFPNNRMIGYYFGISALIWVALGFLIWTILAGVISGFIFIALVFDPPYRFLRKLLHAENLPSQLPRPPLSAILSACLSVVVVSGLFIYVGLAGLSVVGFWHQTLAYVCIEVIKILVHR